jgi:hypothetical protein
MDLITSKKCITSLSTSEKANYVFDTRSSVLKMKIQSCKIQNRMQRTPTTTKENSQKQARQINVSKWKIAKKKQKAKKLI